MCNKLKLMLAFIAGMLFALILCQISQNRNNTEVDNSIIGDTPCSATAGVCEVICFSTENINIEEAEVEVVETPPPKSLGEFRITYYCCCEKCCGKWSKYCKTATGTTPRENHTIAVDPKIIPLGTVVTIWGQDYVAEDTGSKVKGKTIDIYLENHQRGYELLAQRGEYAEVYLKEE